MPVQQWNAVPFARSLFSSQMWCGHRSMHLDLGCSAARRAPCGGSLCTLAHSVTWVSRNTGQALVSVSALISSCVGMYQSRTSVPGIVPAGCRLPDSCLARAPRAPSRYRGEPKAHASARCPLVLCESNSQGQGCAHSVDAWHFAVVRCRSHTFPSRGAHLRVYTALDQVLRRCGSSHVARCQNRSLGSSEIWVWWARSRCRCQVLAFRASEGNLVCL
mmetsp:Transcript_15095/g.35359  ORF Transcript_15095/g.35359 Transcript_15095/m.35359 type:complete len:218 (+) Transcript_15095:89-742(+)